MNTIRGSPAGLLPVEPSTDPPPVRPPALENDPLQNRQPAVRKRASRALAPFLMAVCIGVAATVAWESYGTSSTDQQLKAMSLDLAAVRQSVDELNSKVQQMAGDIAAQQTLRRVSAPAPPVPRRAN